MSQYEQELVIKSVSLTPNPARVKQAVKVEVAIELVDIVPYVAAPYCGTVYAGQEICLDVYTEAT